MSSHNTGNPATTGSSTGSSGTGGTQGGSTLKSFMDSTTGKIQEGIGSMTGNQEQKAKGAAKKAAAQEEKDAARQKHHAAEHGSGHDTRYGSANTHAGESNLGNPQWKEGRHAGTAAGAGAAGAGAAMHAGESGRMHGTHEQGGLTGQGMSGQGMTGQTTHGQGLTGQGISGQSTHSQDLPGQTTYGQTQQPSGGEYSHTQPASGSGFGDRKDQAYGAGERMQGAMGAAAAGLTGNRQEQERYNQMHDAGKDKQRTAEVDRQTRSQAKSMGADDLRSVPRSDLREDTGAVGSGGLGGSDLNTDSGAAGHALRSDRRANLRNDPTY
ncbi:hypothetical protein BROUX41_006098 [Berkeleyomyces rouxiae]|uniref:uncharacterized protein n=1 Tax=Berkeleyomyces rouxiae TaxID=2035830 RepID=UPI003B7C9ABB